MSKRLSTAAAMRKKLQSLHDETAFVEGVRRGLEAGITEQRRLADRPVSSRDLDNGVWVRDPITGARSWLRFAV